jgi:hypothetical protein
MNYQRYNLLTMIITSTDPIYSKMTVDKIIEEMEN